MGRRIKLLTVAILIFLCTGISHADPFKFEIRDGHFYRDDQPVSLRSGEMHYIRVPHEYWRHRFRMMKAMGLNCVATYVFWNAHETEPGKWDFSGDRNIAEFIREAGEEGLMVILRPGPYVCAEWDFGGYPWWLQNIPGMEVRRDNAQFLERTRSYINRLYKEVGNLQCTKGGPLIMVQCENEFGSYVAQRKDIPLEEHRAYNDKIKQQLLSAGFDVPLFTSDGDWLFEGGCTPGALPTANGEKDVDTLKARIGRYNNGQGPYMVAEFYPGWLTHWAEPIFQTDVHALSRKVDEFLSRGVDFNLYMVHGGTNFGFTSGANYTDERNIQPDLTSYDYTAPISEPGWRTDKYDSLRTVIAAHVDYELPPVPERIPVISIPEIRLSRVVDGISWMLRQTSVSNTLPLNFEDLSQGNGYVLYERTFPEGRSGKLEIRGLRDYATVYVNDVRAGVLDRNINLYSMDIDIPDGAILRILVENMGRINYGSQITENHKGILGDVRIDGNAVRGKWSMYKVPFSTVPDEKGLKAAGKPVAKGLPVIYEGTFKLKETGDTFLDMTSWGKGIVFVNGHNLGRYWYKGPQQTLYLPGVWLNKGKNHIVVFEQLDDEIHSVISSRDKPELYLLRM